MSYVLMICYFVDKMEIKATLLKIGKSKGEFTALFLSRAGEFSTKPCLSIEPKQSHA